MTFPWDLLPSKHGQECTVVKLAWVTFHALKQLVCYSGFFPMVKSFANVLWLWISFGMVLVNVCLQRVLTVSTRLMFCISTSSYTLHLEGARLNLWEREREMLNSRSGGWAVTESPSASQHRIHLYILWPIKPKAACTSFCSPLD